MLRSQTLLVVGAGASKEAGFPLGIELRDQLTKMLSLGFEYGGGQRSGDRALGQHLLGLAQNDHPKAQALQDAALMVARKLPQVSSIDALLSLLTDENAIEIAKMAIVLAIARAEKNSIIYREDKNNYDARYFGALSTTWYGKLFEILHQRVPISKVDALFDNLGVISFNYDRSLEQFLFRAVQNLYDLSDEAAAKVMDRLPIVHPYGRIAPLPWQARGGAAYGSLPRLESAAGSIRTFSEQIAEPGLQERIDEIVSDSERIFFLGFGFIGENMDILKPNEPMARKPLRGTAYRLSKSNTDHVETLLEEWLDEPDYLHGGLEIDPSVSLETSTTCADYLEQFSRFVAA